MQDKTIPTKKADRIEAFLNAIDAYTPKDGQLENQFRSFARSIARSIDGRYIEHHPIPELLPDLEISLKAVQRRIGASINIHVEAVDEALGVLNICMPDQTFVVSTILQSLEHLDLVRTRYFSSIIRVQRNEEGDIEQLGGPAAQKEVMFRAEFEGRHLKKDIVRLKKLLEERLDSIQIIVSDFHNMREVVSRTAESIEELSKSRPDQRPAHESNAKFLRWLLDENFILFGTKHLGISNAADCLPTLGHGRFEDHRGIQIDDAETEVLNLGGIAPFLWVRKSKRESYTYRPGPVDHILVQTWSANGRAEGLLIIEGMFSFQALVQARTSVPRLDKLIHQLYSEFDVEKGTHRYRTIRNAFNSLPMEYLFTLEAADIHSLIDDFLDVDADQRVHVSVTVEEQQNYAFIFVAVPRSHYNEELRVQVRRLLKDMFSASYVDGGTYAGSADSVTFHYFLSGIDPQSQVVPGALKQQIAELASPWSDRLRDALKQTSSASTSRELYHRYLEAFPPRYREETSVARAVTDINILEHLDRFDCDLFRDEQDRSLGGTRLRLFENEATPLSEILPILDHFGLKIIDQVPTIVRVPDREEQTITTFRIHGLHRGSFNLLLGRRNRLREGVRAVMAGMLDDDELNNLLLSADISWTYVGLMRAYLMYARQAGSPYTIARIHEALFAHPPIVHALCDMFQARFDPGFGESSDPNAPERIERVERHKATLLRLLEDVQDLSSDDILRTYLYLIEATVRTNFYVRDPMQTAEIVLKLDPQQIPRMPLPRPYREIYVHHPKVAGLHLRGGPVARGGIRWSDRVLDFRTEVLSLMATQNLKNAVIVPKGAKGCFILRKPSIDMNTRRQEADALYKVFIDGLLSVTDNLNEAGETITPEGLICYDDADPYLVVAADKGTAHLSDTANSVAIDHRFWLHDAFASGGSQGYDHKKEGITARGAWECVKRHFRETGIDPESDVIQVVGIGDMSGDVFGNGLLRSKTVQLVAAFDHRHIFLDPNPDPQKSHEARLALFKKGRSAWTDYPSELISEGGGIYPRGTKSITLSEQVQKALGIQVSKLSGNALIQAILSAPVHLLWNGGIGTYIKSDDEQHIDVRDANNDEVRIDASQVRAKVIGEGGNLGITAKARIALAEQGTSLNTDAIDNSAGVDMSDHEVNLKIFFERLIATSKITREERDRWMEAIKPEITRKVLANNWTQSRLISLDEQRSRQDIERFKRAIHWLENEVPFDRAHMHLPDDPTLNSRRESGKPLYRPELSVLAANAKLALRRQLEHAEFDSALTDPYLLEYFPSELTEQFDVHTHPLKKEIAYTVMTNRIIDEAGATWLSELSIQSGQTTTALIEAYLHAQNLLSAHNIRRTLEEQESSLAPTTEYTLRLALQHALEQLTLWLVRRNWSADKTAIFAKSFEQATALFVELADNKRSKRIQRERAQWHQAKLPMDAADQVAHLEHVIDIACIAELTLVTDEAIEKCGQRYFDIGEKTGVLSMLKKNQHRTVQGDYTRPAVAALDDQLRQALIHLSKDEKSLGKVDQITEAIAPLMAGSTSIATMVLVNDRLRSNMDASQ